ncbi:prolipoprotein diacylglyceryl transferase [Desulfotignum phosphitoxidans]|uniref:Phosphatidylglycerol--prolipoprotein diacylglyceryl transferase n=1 Tax=Desulfotignum phosphitoxidans DSM 13687 TaxID=1286635 RepID=S0FXG3_9BACT|nr:prolipoprotein diacylglyceryl transferase [Desulfotignum phosphitoxidans]EMS79430.1 prolipoprotein diacylglyceryl transferase Lgt [Desulfotignum phosphitoxidans DSM 13687]
MHPILVHFGSFTLYTYGFFLAMGFLAAIWFSKRNARFYDLKPDDISDLFFVILISGIVGARLLYVIINFDDFKASPLDIFKLWNGGLVFFGGFIGAVAASIVTLRIKKLPFFKTADTIAPGVALGHGIGRLGCFFAGCCYGRQCDLPIAVQFSHPDSLAPLHVPLHPTQIYMVAANLILFLILIFLQRRKRFHGMIFLSYIILYSVFRFIIEFFRGDFRGDFFLEFLSVSQGIGILAIVIALAAMVKLALSSRGDR